MTDEESALHFLEHYRECYPTLRRLVWGSGGRPLYTLTREDLAKVQASVTPEVRETLTAECKDLEGKLNMIIFMLGLDTPGNYIFNNVEAKAACIYKQIIESRGQARGNLREPATRAAGREF
jgi:hypothetical protein